MNTAITIVIIAFTLFVGFVIGKYHDFPQFTLGHEINLVDSLAIIVNFGLAIYISSIIDRSKNITGVEKEIIVRRLEKLIDYCENFSTTVQRNPFLYVEASSFRKYVYTSLETIRNAVDNSSSKYDPIFRINIDNELGPIHNLLTTTSLGSRQAPNQPVVVVNNNVAYSLIRVREIEAKLNIIVNNLIALQLSINKS